MIRFKKILYEDPSSDAKKLGLWHIGYGRYVALGKNQQAKLVAVSRKGVLKFVGKDKELWLNKLNQLNEQTQKIDIFKFDDFKFIRNSTHMLLINKEKKVYAECIFQEYSKYYDSVWNEKLKKEIIYKTLNGKSAIVIEMIFSFVLGAGKLLIEYMKKFAKKQNKEYLILNNVREQYKKYYKI